MAQLNQTPTIADIGAFLNPELIEPEFDDADFELLAAQDYWACHRATVEAA